MGRFFDTLAGKKVAFIGAGVTNGELVKLFAKAGALVTLCDKKQEEDFGEYAQQLRQLGVTLSLGQGYLTGLEGQEMILRSPGFRYYTPELQQAIAKGALVTSDLELFFEHCPCKIVGITGSDGKTTTTSLIAAMYKAQGFTVHLGGNIGSALLPVVDKVKPEDVAVVELSSFQLISMKCSPHVAVVTNVTPNHLDQHKDMQEYVDAKRNILLHQSEQDIAVLGFENETSRQMQQDCKGSVRFFSRLRPVSQGAFLDEKGMLCLAGDGGIVPVVSQQEVKLRGVHNIENLLAAFAAVEKDVSPKVMARIARSFAGVEHRIEPVRQLDGVWWYNDSIASSPTRVIAGLRSFEQKIILIAGGYDKNIPFEPMAQDVISRVKLMILMGPAAEKIEKAISQAPGYAQSGLRILRAESMEQAVLLARENAVCNDVVMLSPACASFDAYANFEVRGKHFKELVNKL